MDGDASGFVSGVQRCFAGLRDPRVQASCEHLLFDIVSISILAVACGADDWTDLETFGNKRREWLAALELSDFERQVAQHILVEARDRVDFLCDVGLGYLTLDRGTRTLSGGEAQRIALANALGSRLVDTLYVLDEPSIGLHPRDMGRLLGLLRRLRDAGNTVLVVEHDLEAVRQADHVIELGPGSGERGGEVVYAGPLDGALRGSLTGRYLAGELAIPVPARRRPVRRKIVLRGAREHNLRDIDVEIPLGTLTVVTGVSGSGKSTLVHDVLYRALELELAGEHSAKLHLGERVGTWRQLSGVDGIEAVVLVDQEPIGRTPRSNPVTYVRAYDEIRRIIREEEPPKPSTRLTEELVAADKLKSEIRNPKSEIDSASRRLQQLKELIPLLRGDLDWIVMKCLEKDRARRYETATALAADLQRHLHNEPVTASPPSRLYRFQKLVRRNKLAFTAGAAVAAALIVGLTLSTLLFFREKEASRTQTRLRQKAEAAEKSALAQTERAETASTESRMTLAASDFSQAVRLIEQEEAGDALPHLARSLRNNKTNDAALTRLMTLLTYRRWMLPRLAVRHEGGVMSAEFSPDGGRLVTASRDGTARVWDAQMGAPLTGPLKHGADVTSARFSPDGGRVVTASTDGTVRVWDAKTGEPLTAPLRCGGAVTSAQFSPDGMRIVTASDDGSGLVWDASTGQPLGELLKHAGGVISAEFSPDGTQIVTASRDKTARVWDAQTGRPLGEALRAADGSEAFVSSARFSPDGRRVVTASNGGRVRVWDAQTGQPLARPIKHSPYVIAEFSPDGGRLVTAAFDGTARVWDAQSGQPLAKPLKHQDRISRAQFSPDGKCVVTASDDKTARVWDARTGQPLAERLVHGDRVSTARFSPDGQRLVTASWDGTARVWDARPRPALALALPLQQSTNVSFAQFSPDGKRLVTISKDGAVRIWDAQTGQPRTEPFTHGGIVMSAQFSPDGQRLVTASLDHTARVWDVQTGQPLIAPMQHEDEVRWAQFSPDGRQVLTVSSDKTARVWDAQTGRPMTEPLK